MGIHNTLTRRLEDLEPLETDHVRLYTCGPTVYDFAHRELPDLRLGGPPPAHAAVPRVPGHAGDEHHRHRGQDHRQGAGGGNDHRSSYAFDDEGTPARREYLIRAGILERPLGGALSQARSGLPGVARARASGWNRPAIDRMANLNLEPGEHGLDDLIGMVEEGVLMDTNRSWSIDDTRNKFQFGCEYGRRIRAGTLAEVVRNPGYRGPPPASGAASSASAIARPTGCTGWRAAARASRTSCWRWGTRPRRVSSGRSSASAGPAPRRSPREQPHIAVTVTVGVAERDARHDQAGTVVAAADAALYRAKAAGRNRLSR